MDFLLTIIVIAAAYFGIRWMMSEQSENRIVQPRVVEPPISRRNGKTPTGLRRRRLDGGFYPIGYDGSYYDGEDLVDEILFAAEIAVADALIDEMIDERGSLSIEDDTVSELVVEETEPEPESIAVNDDDDIRSGFGSVFDGGGSDDSWGGSDDSDSDSGSDD